MRLHINLAMPERRSLCGSLDAQSSLLYRLGDSLQYLLCPVGTPFPSLFGRMQVEFPLSQDVIKERCCACQRVAFNRTPLQFHLSSRACRSQSLRTYSLTIPRLSQSLDATTMPWTSTTSNPLWIPQVTFLASPPPMASNVSFRRSLSPRFRRHS